MGDLGREELGGVGRCREEGNNVWMWLEGARREGLRELGTKERGCGGGWSG